MRIRVIDVLDLLAAGLSHTQIVEELPDLELEDVKAAIAFRRAAWTTRSYPNDPLA